MGNVTELTALSDRVETLELELETQLELQREIFARLGRVIVEADARDRKADNRYAELLVMHDFLQGHVGGKPCLFRHGVGCENEIRTCGKQLDYYCA